MLFPFVAHPVPSCRRAGAALLATLALAGLCACGGGADDTVAQDTTHAAPQASGSAGPSSGVVAAEQLPSIESTAGGLPTDLQAQDAAERTAQAS